MAEASDKRAIIRQNLLDAGCDMGMIEKCMELAEKRDESVLLHMLERYKDELLETVLNSRSGSTAWTIWCIGSERGSIMDKKEFLNYLREGTLWQETRNCTR